MLTGTAFFRWVSLRSNQPQSTSKDRLVKPKVPPNKVSDSRLEGPLMEHMGLSDLIESY